MKHSFSIIDDISSFDYVLFDLDNTLINETDYLFEAYDIIALRNSSNYTDYKIKKYFLIDYFNLNGRLNLFDEFILYFKLSITCKDCLEILRTVILKNGLKLKDDAQKILSLLTKYSISYSILTNGNIQQQKNKIDQIKWDLVIQPDEIIFANLYIPKPDHSAFLHWNRRMLYKKIIYIGDSNIDQEFSERAGISFFNINNLTI
jgi:FMN phosphatase YigB (HAD superfamily)